MLSPRLSFMRTLHSVSLSLYYITITHQEIYEASYSCKIKFRNECGGGIDHYRYDGARFTSL